MKLAEGITLKAVKRVENPNYIFLDLVIDKNAKPGERTFQFRSAGFRHVKIKYELKARNKENGKTSNTGCNCQGFYLPDDA